MRYRSRGDCGPVNRRDGDDRHLDQSPDDILISCIDDLTALFLGHPGAADRALEVSASAESRVLAGDHDAGERAVPRQLTKPLGNLPTFLRAERIALLRPIENGDSDIAAAFKSQSHCDPPNNVRHFPQNERQCPASSLKRHIYANREQAC